MAPPADEVPVFAALTSTLHILALVLGLPGVWFRGRALRRGDIPGVLAADGVWGVAALLWIATGLTRVFLTEKGPAWYGSQPLFWLKMGIFAAVFLLEVFPMVTFIRWRARLRRGQELDLSVVPTLLRINGLEVLLTVCLPFVASMMARGLFG